MLLDFFARLPHKIAAWPTHRKALFAFACAVFLVEIALRYLAPQSLAYKRWTHFFEGIGAVWSAVWLSLIYAIAVGPISIAMRLTGKDPLDRSLAKEPTWWRPHEASPLGPEASARHQF